MGAHIYWLNVCVWVCECTCAIIQHFALSLSFYPFSAREYCMHNVSSLKIHPLQCYRDNECTPNATGLLLLVLYRYLSRFVPIVWYNASAHHAQDIHKF